MVTIAELLGWKPEQLGEVADQLVRRRKTLTNLQDETDAAAPPATWRHTAGDNARKDHERLRLKLLDMVSEVSEVAVELDSAEKVLARAQRHLEEALTTASGYSLEVNRRTGEVTGPPVSLIEAPVQQIQIATVVSLIEAALISADTADGDLAAMLGKAARHQLDGGTGSLADAALPSYLRGMTEDEIVDYALEHPELGPDFLPALPESTRSKIGLELAELAEGINGDANIEDGMYARQLERADYDDMAGLDELMAGLGQDEVVSTSFLTELGPRGLIDLNSSLVNSQPPLPGPYGQEAPDADRDWDGLLGRMQTHLGETLAAGTSDDEPAGSSSRVSEDWIRELDEQGREEFPIADPSMGGPEKVYGYQLLAPVLGEGDQSTSLLTTIGSGMYDFERNYADENDGQLPWTEKPPTPYGGNQTDNSINVGEHFRLDFTDGTGTSVPTGLDPMGGLLEGLGNNPDAAREFFNAENGEHDSSRVDYLLTDRDWPTETWGGGAYNAEAGTFPTGIESLGDALVSATLHDMDGASDRQGGATIAEEIVRSSTNGSDAMGEIEDSDGDKYARFQETDIIAPELRDNMAQIMRGYIGDVHGSINNAQGMRDADFDPYAPGTQAVAARFEGRDLAMFLADIGKDESAARLVADAEVAYAGLGYDHYLNDPELTTAERYDGIQGRVNPAYGNVMGALDLGRAEAMVEAGQAADQDHNDEVTMRYQVAGALTNEVVGLGMSKASIPVGGNLVGMGIDQALNQAMHDDFQDSTGRSNFDVGVLHASGSEAARVMSEAAMYRNIEPEALRGTSLLDAQGNSVPMQDWSEAQVLEWRGFLNAEEPTLALVSANASAEYERGFNTAKTQLQFTD